jgi:hypothetical protein
VKRIVPFLILLALVSSCGKSKSGISVTSLPRDSVIPREQMVKMLADIHVLEAALQARKQKGAEEQNMSAFYYTRLFSKYHMSGKRFRKNLANYQVDPDEFFELYGDVIKELDSRITSRNPGRTKK